MKQNDKTSESFPSELLEEALYFIHDLMDDAQLEFFAMGKTAEQLVNDLWLEGNKLEFGVKKRNLTADNLSVLKEAVPSIDIQDRKIIMEYSGIPIELKIIKLHYRVLDNLDTIMYGPGLEVFLVPNPFEAFMRMGKFLH
jgi:hypothetical protein